MDSGSIKPRRTGFGVALAAQRTPAPAPAPAPEAARCACRHSCSGPRVHSASRMSDRRIPRAT